MASLDLRKDGLLGLLSKLNFLYKVVQENNLELTAGFHLLRVASCASKHISAINEIVILIKLLRDNGMAVPSILFVQKPPTTIANLPNEILDAVFAEFLRAEGWSADFLVPSHTIRTGGDPHLQNNQVGLKNLTKLINRIGQNHQLRAVAAAGISSFFTFSSSNYYQARDPSIPASIRSLLLPNIKHLHLSVAYGWGPVRTRNIFFDFPIPSKPPTADFTRFSGTAIAVTKGEFIRMRAALPKLSSVTIELDIAPIRLANQQGKTTRLLRDLRGFNGVKCMIRGGLWLDLTNATMEQKERTHIEILDAVLSGEEWIQVDTVDNLKLHIPALHGHAEEMQLEWEIVRGVRCTQGLLQTWDACIGYWESDMQQAAWWEWMRTYGLE